MLNEFRVGRGEIQDRGVQGSARLIGELLECCVLLRRHPKQERDLVGGSPYTAVRFFRLPVRNLGLRHFVTASVSILGQLLRYGTKIIPEAATAQALITASGNFFMDWRERLRTEIKRRGLTERDYAKTVGLHPSNLSQYLTGERTPKADFFRSVRFSGISLDWLFTGEGNPDADADREPSTESDAERLISELKEVMAKYKPDASPSGGNDVDNSAT